jgi:hypothetical protein
MVVLNFFSDVSADSHTILGACTRYELVGEPTLTAGFQGPDDLKIVQVRHHPRHPSLQHVWRRFGKLDTPAFHNRGLIDPRPSTNKQTCMLPCACAHYCFISSLFKVWSFTRVPLVTGGSIGTTRESADSNKVAGKHIIKQFRRFDIHDSVVDHVVDRSRRVVEFVGKAS